MPIPDEPSPGAPPLGWFYRFKCWLTGVDPEILAACPPRDQDSVNAIFLLQVGAWSWQAFIFSVVAHQMLAMPGELRPELIAIAVLLASIIALIDSFMIIRASWYLHGLEELRRGGLMLPGSLAIKLKSAAFMAFRLLLASTLVQLVAAFVAIMVFGKDVDRGIDADFHRRNATIFAAAESRYDGETAAVRDERVRQAASIAQTDGDASLLRRGAATPPPTDEDVRDLRKRRSRLETEKQSADASVSRTRLAARHGGEAAAGRLRMAVNHAAAIARDLSATRQRLAEAEARVARETQDQNSRVDTRLGQIASDHTEQVARLAALDARLAERAQAREAAIRASVQRDPALQPRDDGTLARVHVLADLAEDRHNLFIILLIDVSFFAIELAAVLAKVTTFVPATYATELAKTEHLRAFETSRLIAERIKLIGAAPPTAPTPADMQAPDPPADDGGPVFEAGERNAESATELDASLRQAARAAQARAAAVASRGKNKPSGAEASPQPDDAPRRPRGRPPGPRQLPPQAEASLDFGQNPPFGPPDTPSDS